jgi:sporulation protein YlmC with PRC-barrel domain
MTHYGNLGTQVITDTIRDVRGTTVRGPDGQKLGRVDDVILDHDTMEIRYLIVDSDGWLETGSFLLPADLVSSDQNHEDGLATEVTRQQIAQAPVYENSTLDSEDDWKRYEQEFSKHYEEDPVLHMKDTDRIVTPPEEPASTPSSDQATAASQNPPLNAAQLFPDRLTDTFPDPAPGAGKVTLRPRQVARVEEAASGATLLKPRWWESFENYLRLNKSDIRSNCSHCSTKAA